MPRLRGLLVSEGVLLPGLGEADDGQGELVERRLLAQAAVVDQAEQVLEGPAQAPQLGGAGAAAAQLLAAEGHAVEERPVPIEGRGDEARELGPDAEAAAAQGAALACGQGREAQAPRQRVAQEAELGGGEGGRRSEGRRGRRR